MHFSFADALDNRYQTFDKTYELAGTYVVNVSAWNHHRDVIYGKTKFVHNITQEIVVQYAIDEFTDGSEEFWMRDNGCEFST